MEIDKFERKEKIKQLQKYLREIAKVDNRIPLLSIDGFFFDDETEKLEVEVAIDKYKPSGEYYFDNIFELDIENKQNISPNKISRIKKVFKETLTCSSCVSQPYMNRFIRDIRIVGILI